MALDRAEVGRDIPLSQNTTRLIEEAVDAHLPVRVDREGNLCHTVQKGEFLYGIAAKWLEAQGKHPSSKETWAEVKRIAKENGLTDQNDIKVGQPLKLGKAEAEAVREAPRAPARVERTAPPPAPLSEKDVPKPYRDEYGTVFNVLGLPVFDGKPGTSHRWTDERESLCPSKRNSSQPYDGKFGDMPSTQFNYDGKLKTGHLDGNFTASEQVGPNGEILERSMSLQGAMNGKDARKMTLSVRSDFRDASGTLRTDLDSLGKTVADFEGVNSVMSRFNQKTGNYDVYIQTNEGLYTGTADKKGNLRELSFKTNEQREQEYQAQWLYQKTDAQIELEARQQEFDEAKANLRTARDDRHKYGE